MGSSTLGARNQCSASEIKSVPPSTFKNERGWRENMNAEQLQHTEQHRLLSSRQTKKTELFCTCFVRSTSWKDSRGTCPITKGPDDLEACDPKNTHPLLPKHTFALGEPVSRFAGDCFLCWLSVTLSKRVKPGHLLGWCGCSWTSHMPHAIAVVGWSPTFGLSPKNNMAAQT